MALWVCNRCGCEFAVGLRMCPQCTAEDAHEKGDEEMAPKITHANGATYAEGEPGWDGTSSETSSEKDETSTSSSEQLDQSPAPTTENPSANPQTGQDSSAPSTDGESKTSPESADQPELKGAELDQALTDRGLSKSGTADEKRARVAEHDAAKAAEQTGE